MSGPQNLLRTLIVTSLTVDAVCFSQIDVIIAEESWNVGNLDNLNFYEDEREVLPDEDDEDTNPEEADFDDVR